MMAKFGKLFLSRNSNGQDRPDGPGRPDVPPRSERGVALVITLLLMSLMTALGLAMVLSVNSDLLINGYYRNYRGAFYAADAGLSIARQALVNQVVAAVPNAFTRPPLPANENVVLQTFINNTYGAAYNNVQSASSWNEAYLATAAIPNAANCTVTASGTNPVGTCAGDALATAYQYIYSYSITSNGRSANTQLTNVTETGNITINVTQTGAVGNQSFSGYGMFIDQQPICSGSYLVPGIISGPVFTNGGWTFGTTGSYIFTDPVGSVNPNAGYQFGSCFQSPNASYTSGAQTIAPTYQAGHAWGQPAVTLPPNSFSQQRAVLDGMGTNTAAPTNAEKNAALKSISAAQYPAAGAASGVFLPYNASNQITGGGIYVEGAATVVLDAQTAGVQKYTIVNAGVTTTITVNQAANTTTMVSGATTKVLTGVPMELPPAVAAATPATMLFVNGAITSLKGPGQGLPAIQDASAVTITSSGAVTITGDILYKTEPVTTTANQVVAGTTPACCAGLPADTLIPGHNNGQALGIFTANGNVNLANGQANGNLQIDASIATIAAGGSGGITNTGAAINTLNIVGGRIQNTIQNIGATTRNVFFDRRYAPGSGFAPPWFPSTTIVLGVGTSVVTVPSIQPISWVTAPQ